MDKRQDLLKKIEELRGRNEVMRQEQFQRSTYFLLFRWRNSYDKYVISSKHDDGYALSKWYVNWHWQYDLWRTIRTWIKNGKCFKRYIGRTICPTCQSTSWIRYVRSMFDMLL